MTNPNEIPQMMTPKEVAKVLCCSVDYVRKLSSEGQIPGARKVGSRWRYDRLEIMREYGLSDSIES